MQKRNGILFLILSVVLILGCSFSSFAMTPYSGMSFSTFEDGPWSGCSASFMGVKSDGAVASYALPDWRDGSSVGEGYYKLTFSTKYMDGFLYSGSVSVYNMVIASEEPLIELYVVDNIGNVLTECLETAYIGSDGDVYFYGASFFNGAGFAFRSSSALYLTELAPAFNGGDYHDFIMNNLPYVGGVYDGSSVGIRYSGMSYYNSVAPFTASYGYTYPVFPMVFDSSRFGSENVEFVFASNDGVLNADEVYTFNFEVYNVPSGHGLVSGYPYLDAELNNNVLTFDVSGYGVPLGNIGLSLTSGVSGGPNSYGFRYISSESSDIGSLPPDGSGGSEGSGSPDYSSALSSIGARLDEVMAAVSEGSQQIVNNITYQTTQITTTITNTVTNMTQQITQGLSDVKQGITDKLQGVQKGITDKLGQVQDGINNKLEDVQNEIVNGYDNTGIDQDAAELDSSLKEYDEAEQNVLDNVNDSLNDFEFDAGFDDYKTIIQTVSDFLQALYDASGGLKVLINLSMLMSIAGIVIGVYRIRGGG